MTNTEKCFRDYIAMIEQGCNVNLTEEQIKKVIENCFNNDNLIDTIYAEITDEIENVVGELNP